MAARPGTVTVGGGAKLRSLFLGGFGVVAAIVAIVVAGHFAGGVDSNGGLDPYGLPETLPGMISSFGPDARVVEVIVGSSGVYYQVVGADHKLHIRDYAIDQSEVEAGVTGYNRKTGDFVHPLTPAESRGAVVTLGQLDPGVVETLYGEVGFPRQGSSATLTGHTWFLQSGADPDHRWVASYDGRALRPTEAPAPAG